MASAEKQPRVNPKWLVRKLLCALPEGSKDSDFSMLNALWLFSDDTFITEADALEGRFQFTGNASYSQLGRVCGITSEGIKKRMRRLRELAIVDWKPTQHGIKYAVALYKAESKLEGDNQNAMLTYLEGLEDMPGENGKPTASKSCVIEDDEEDEVGTGVPTRALCEVGIRVPGANAEVGTSNNRGRYSGPYQVGTRVAEVGSGVSPLALSGLKTSGEAGSDEDNTTPATRENLGETPNPRTQGRPLATPVQVREPIPYKALHGHFQWEAGEYRGSCSVCQRFGRLYGSKQEPVYETPSSAPPPATEPVTVKSFVIEDDEED